MQQQVKNIWRTELSRLPVSGWIVSKHERNAVRHNIWNTGGDARRFDSNCDESETDKANCEIPEEAKTTSFG